MLRRIYVLLALAPAACVTANSEVRTAEPEQTDGPPSSPEEWASFPRRPPPPRDLAHGERRGEVAARWAESWVGLQSLKGVEGDLPDDCTGLVRLAYAQIGVPLIGPEAHPRDNGVTAIYRRAEAAGALHWRRPQPGDLVFFRETYDRNHDGKRNDGLTHVAIVESAEPDGTVRIVHRVSHGVRESKLNLRAPRSEKLNDILRGASRHFRAYLTGELFVAYASADRLAESIRIALSQR